MSGIDGHMIDKNAYSTETLNTFSFISAYFIDLFYNHLYTQAIRFHRNQQVATVTDGYKASLDAYLQNINNYDKELYSDLVHGIHKSFIDYGFRGISYQACIDKIVKEFIPQDYWKIISFDDKSKILGTIITNSSRAMVYKIISSHLSDIIDNHGDAENANILQDEYIEILIMEREKLYHEFINAKTNNGSDSSMFAAMEKEILELSKQKNELRHQNHDLKKELLNLQKKMLVLCRHIKAYSQKIKELEGDVAKYKAASVAATVANNAPERSTHRTTVDEPQFQPKYNSEPISGGTAGATTQQIPVARTVSQQYYNSAQVSNIKTDTHLTRENTQDATDLWEDEEGEEDEDANEYDDEQESANKQFSLDDDDLYTLE